MRFALYVLAGVLGSVLGLAVVFHFQSEEPVEPVSIRLSLEQRLLDLNDRLSQARYRARVEMLRAEELQFQLDRLASMRAGDRLTTVSRTAREHREKKRENK
ncbi:hypothetical protein LCGC14_1435960 [marine sediment metagenome]|uniref:Uncharacterized protein n=1 Tax=marine sediment metagenome TaxID=412755 RepID=A0A0F9JM72_9ZZZZ